MPTTEATAEVKAIFSMVDNSAGVAKQITDNLKGMADAAKNVATEVPRSLAEVARQAGVAWRPTDIVQPVVPDVKPVDAGAVTESLNLAPEVDKISGHFGKLGATIDSVANNIRTKLTGAFASVESKAHSVATAIGQHWTALSTALELSVGGAIEAGAEYAFHGAQKLVDQVEKLGPRAQAIGIGIPELQDFNRAAEDTGVSVEGLDKVLTKFTATLGAVQAGKGAGSKAAGAALEDLGVSAKNADGSLRTVSDVMPEVIDKLNAIHDPTQRAADAAALFKLRWSDLAPLMAVGSEAFGKARVEQEKIGHITEKQTKNAEDYFASHKRMNASLDDLQETIGGHLLPAMTPLQDAISGIANEFDHWAKSADGVAASTKFATDLGSVLKSTTEDIEGVITAYKWLDENVAPIMNKLLPSPEFVQEMHDRWVAIGKELFDFGGAGTTPVPEGGAPNLPTWTPGGILAPPVTSEGGGPMPLEAITGAPGPIAPNGTVNVNITHDNAPPGTRMNVSTQGTGIKTTANTGWSMPGIQNPWEQPKQPQGPWAPQ